MLMAESEACSDEWFMCSAQVKIAVVGQGTANILEAYPGFDNKLIGFLPSKVRECQHLCCQMSGSNSSRAPSKLRCPDRAKKLYNPLSIRAVGQR